VGKTRLVIADDHAVFRSGLRRLLESTAHLKVVGEAGKGNEVVTLVNELRPHVLLLDVRLPELSGLGVLKQLGASCDTRVLLLTAGIDNKDAVSALKSGARGVLLKNTTTQLVFRSIDVVRSGQYWVYQDSASDLAGALSRLAESAADPKKQDSRFNLTPRELAVLKAVVSGCANKAIAQQFSISEQTVKHHVTNIFNKTGTSNRLELTLFAIGQGLLLVALPRQLSLTRQS
jgi:two-component system nitrate/nitrite response regulator NarL